MNKQIIAAVLGVVVVGGGWYLYAKSSEEKIQAPSEQNIENTNPNTKKISFSSLISQGGSHMCTVNQNVGNIESKGTVYMMSGKLRGEFKSSVGGMNIETIFVVRDGYSYTWSSALPNVGYKVAVLDSTTPNSTATGVASYSFNAEQIGEYECKDWAPNETFFALPSGIKFTEIKR